MNKILSTLFLALSVLMPLNLWAQGTQEIIMSDGFAEGGLGWKVRNDNVILDANASAAGPRILHDQTGFTSDVLYLCSRGTNGGHCVAWYGVADKKLTLQSGSYHLTFNAASFDSELPVLKVQVLPVNAVSLTATDEYLADVQPLVEESKTLVTNFKSSIDATLFDVVIPITDEGDYVLRFETSDSIGSTATWGDACVIGNVQITGEGTSSSVEPYAVLTTDTTLILNQSVTGVTYGQTLTFYYDDQKEARNGMDVGPFNFAWNSTTNTSLVKGRVWNDQVEQITQVIFDSSFANCTSITSTAYWFYNCVNLTTITGITNFQTDSVTDMVNMFGGCSSLTNLDLSSFNTANVTSMASMFYRCSSLTSLDLSNFNTSNVGTMGDMFYRCSGLTSLDLSNFNTANVTYLGGMFAECSNLVTIYVGSGWTFSSETNGEGMFDACTSLKGGMGTTFSEDHIHMDYAHIDGGISNPGYLTAKDASEPENSRISLQSVPFNSYTGWGINAQVTGTANCEWVLNEATAVAYGDSNVKDGADLSSYSKLIVTVTEGTPRFLLNRDEEEGQWSENEDESHLIDNTKGGWSSKYFTQESTTNGVVYTVDLKQILKDKGFVRLHAIKSVWGEQVTVTSMELEQNELTTVYHVDYSTYSAYPFFVMDYVPEWNGGVMTDYGAMYKYVTLDNDVGETSDVIVTTNDGTQYYKISLSEPLWHHYFIADQIPTDGGGNYIVKAMVRASEPCTFDVNMAWSWDNEQHVDTPISVGTDWQEIVWRHNGIGGNSCFMLAQVGNQTATIEWKWLTVYKEQTETVDTLEAYAVWTDNFVFDEETGEELRIQALTFYYDTNKNSYIGVDNTTVYPISDGGVTHEWRPWCLNFNRVVFDESFALYKPTSTASWFDGMENLTAINGIENLNTKDVTDMNSMFLGCKTLTSIDLSHFNTASVTNMTRMFYGCSALETLDMTSFNTSNVMYMGEMFYNCTALKTIYVGSEWTTATLAGSESMFAGCSSLVGGRGTTYDADHTDASYAHIDGGMANPGYFTAKGGLADPLLARLYDNLALTTTDGNADGGNNDLSGSIDAAQTSLVRAMWNLQELPTDESYCVWMDAGIPALNTNTWSNSTQTDAMKGLYARLYHGIILANNYLANQHDGDMGKQAEARFLRALQYYYLMDHFGNVPLLTDTIDRQPLPVWEATPRDIELPTRVEMFNYIESELQESLNSLPATNSYGRATATAARLLLARLYLNSEVYTGTARWQEARSYAESVINGGTFQLAPIYRNLFMGDNDSNGAQQEIILPAIYDGNTRTDYGGTTFLVASSFTNGEGDNGTTQVWAGNVSKPDFVNKFFTQTADIPYASPEQTASAAGDDRALFYGINHSYELRNGDSFSDGFPYQKFTNVRSNGTSPVSSKFADTDFPLMRLGEAYLIAAEADARLNGSATSMQGTQYINMLRNRANATTSTAGYSLSDICDEWSREMGYEAVRRTTLIRFGRFGGQTDYSWAWKGGSYDGTAFDAGMNTYPIPAVEVGSTPEPYVVLTDSNTVMTFYYDGQKATRVGIDINNSNLGDSPSPYGTATSAVFDASFANYYPTSTAYWFQNCSALTSISGVENLKTDNITNMSEMFSDCSGLTALDVSGFKTDNVTDMGAMFSGCSGLTSLDVTSFKTDNVTDMSGMFYRCFGLTSLDVTSFKTDNVTNMSWMFNECSGLTSLDVTNFKTDNVTNMGGMFCGCSGLTGLNVTNFKTDNVTDMRSMFADCFGLTSLDVTSFKTDNVTNMYAMFPGCSGLTTLDLSGFKTNRVTYMNNMFDDCTNLTTIYVGSEWSTESVRDSSSVFNNCTSLVGGQGTVYDANHVDASYAHIDGGPDNPGYFTRSVDAPYVAPKVYFVLSENNTKLTFYYDTQMDSRGGSGFFDSSLAPEVLYYVNDFGTIKTVIFDTSFANYRPTSTQSWFVSYNGLTEINGIENLNTTNVTDMRGMFANCSSLTSLDLSSFNTANVTNMENMFNGCSNLTTIYVGSEWSTASVEDGSSMFTNCTSLVGGKGTAYDSNHVDVSYAHIDGGPDNPGYFTRSGDAPYVAPEAYAVLSGDSITLTFYYDKKREERGGRVFQSGTEVYWPNYVTGVTKVSFDESFADFSPTSTSSWFAGFNSLTSVEGMEYLNTEHVTSMISMFQYCENLTSLDLSRLQTGHVETMTNMFYGCKRLANLNLSGFSTANVTSLASMFYGCQSLTMIDLSSFNTSNVTRMEEMFQDCAGLTTLDLTNFNTENVENMTLMFAGCTNLATIYAGSGWSVAKAADSRQMFYDCTSLVGGQGTVYDAEYTDKTYAHIDGGTLNPGYLTLKLAMGDANGDGNINIADAVSTVTNILGQPTEAAFYKYAADMNTDQVIDIFDVTLIVNAAFDAASPAPAMTRGSADNIMMEHISMMADADYIYLGVDQPERFTATQFDVTLPEGMELVDARLASATTDHQLSFVKRGDNEYRVIGLSMSNTTFRSINGQLIKLEVSGSAVDSDVKMSNVLFVTPTATVMTSIDKCLNTAKMADDSLYDLKGQRLSKQQLGKGIYIMNHKKVIIK